MSSPDESKAIIVVDPEDDFAQEIADALPGEDVRHAETSDIALRAVAAGGVGILLVGPNMEFEDGLDLLDAVAAAGSPAGAVVVTKKPSSTQMRRAMRAGVSDVLPVTYEVEELVEAVGHAWPTADAAPPASAAAASGPDSVVVTVFSPKGGAGKSTVCANLAVLLARRGKRVVVVDLDLQFGDAAIMFQVQPKLTIADAMVGFDEVDASNIGDFVVSHESGVDILAAPSQPAQADAVTPESVTAIMGMLRSTYDVIVVDTPAMFTDTVLATIDVSDQLVILGGFDVPSIKNLRLALSTLTRLGVDSETIHVVMTRTNAKVGLRLAEVERTLGATINVGIPSDRSVPISLNHGVPLAIEQPRSPVVTAIANIASRVIGEEVSPLDVGAESKSRRRLLGRSRSAANAPSS